ncbi:MAG: hypothetical protein FJ109_19830 [Deltaproteobacteria bacterium]|nr:hypothetical protein [Deltaproteobacteria bacterium]
MTRNPAATVLQTILAMLLAAGCLESNPQPFPGTKNDTAGRQYGEAAEGGVDAASADMASDGALLPDAAAETLAEVPVPEDGGDVPDADTLPDTPDATDQVAPPDTLVEVTLPIECFHVPYMVPAGQPVPVAVYGVSVSCAKFDHADVKVEGNAVDVQLIGKKMEGECPPCVFDTLGVVWLPALKPGLHMVTVGELPQAKGVIAAAGDLEVPVCLAACAGPLKDTWQLRWLGGIDGVEVTCGVGNVNTPITFGEGCQDHAVAGDDWTGPAEAYFCSQEQIFFGLEPMWETTGSYCTHTLGAGDPDEHAILGLTVDYAGQPSAKLFLMTGN